MKIGKTGAVLICGHEFETHFLMMNQPPFEPLALGVDERRVWFDKKFECNFDFKLTMSVKEQYRFMLFLIDPNNRPPRGMQRK